MRAVPTSEGSFRVAGKVALEEIMARVAEGMRSNK